MRNRVIPATALLFSCAALAGCMSTIGLDRSSTAVNVTDSLPEPDATTVAQDFSNYRIGPNDVLTVEVLQAPELKREGAVDASGNFSLPVVGDVMVGGKTPSQVRDMIADKLRGGYLLDPQVSVNITEARSQLVTVDGAVKSPGMYPVTGRMTLQQAVALARGVERIADLDTVIVFRDVNQQRQAALFSLNDIRSGRQVDPQIYANDIVVVGENAVRGFFSDLRLFPTPGSFIPVF
ncbi:polysaccharide biosynthesis/export family protein [Altererythrobacter sp. Z27]|uniref:polysaccharide biosynthesis/export family protein n=1 Tax=Altererythrobacter sp. Z27 TaxID=3461147 RepID=UPI004043A703